MSGDDRTDEFPVPRKSVGEVYRDVRFMVYHSTRQRAQGECWCCRLFPSNARAQRRSRPCLLVCHKTAMYNSEQLGCSVYGVLTLHPVLWNHYALVDPGTHTAAVLVCASLCLDTPRQRRTVLLRRFTAFFDVATDCLVLHAFSRKPARASTAPAPLYRVLSVQRRPETPDAAVFWCEDLIRKHCTSIRCSSRAPVLAVCRTVHKHTHAGAPTSNNISRSTAQIPGSFARQNSNGSLVVVHYPTRDEYERAAAEATQQSIVKVVGKIAGVEEKGVVLVDTYERVVRVDASRVQPTLRELLHLSDLFVFHPQHLPPDTTEDATRLCHEEETGAVVRLGCRPHVWIPSPSLLCCALLLAKSLICVCTVFLCGQFVHSTPRRPQAGRRVFGLRGASVFAGCPGRRLSRCLCLR